MRWLCPVLGGPHLSAEGCDGGHRARGRCAQRYAGGVAHSGATFTPIEAGKCLLLQNFL